MHHPAIIFFLNSLKVLNYFAPEHGKGACDGETAVIKGFVRSLFRKGSLVIALDDLCKELSENLSNLDGNKCRTHSVHERRFRTVHGKIVHMLPMINRPLSIHPPFFT